MARLRRCAAAGSPSSRRGAASRGERLRRVLNGSQRGSAVVEFTVFAVVAIVPLAWVAMALQQLLSVHNAVQTAAGESLRSYLTAPSASMAVRRADVAAGLILAEHAAVRDYQVRVVCDRPACLTPGATVRVTVSAHTELPQIPVLGIVPALDSRAEQYGVVDAFVAPR